MTTWTTPTILDQYAEPEAESVHIAWNDSELGALKSSGNRVTTKGALVHLARSPKVDYKNKTYYLTATGFNFNVLPDVISGVELRLNADRRGRVTDETIQLLVNNEPVGDNQATLSVDPIKTYGGPANLWGLNSLLKNDINSSFGVLIRLQSHPHYPHKDGAIIGAVELLIY